MTHHTFQCKTRSGNVAVLRAEIPLRPRYRSRAYWLRAPSPEDIAEWRKEIAVDLQRVDGLSHRIDIHEAKPLFPAKTMPAK